MSMMFADAEDIETGAVSVRDLLQQIAHPLGGADFVGGIGRRVDNEAVDSDLHA